MLGTLLGRPKRAASDPGWDDNQYDGWVPAGASWRIGGMSAAGMRVDEELALTLSAVWRATRIIMEPIGGLPLLTYKEQSDGGRKKATDVAVYDLLQCEPNPDMAATPFREGRAGHQVLWGNAFAEIERENPRDLTSEPLALWPIHPSRVRPTTRYDREDWEAYPYLVRNNDTTEVPMRRGEMLHVPGVFPEDGVWGKGVIAYARESLGGALAVEKHGHTYFASGAQPKGIAKLPASILNDPEKRADWRKGWREFHKPGSSEVGLLPAIPDVGYTPITISNEDSQFIGTRVMGVKDVSRFWGVPVYMLGENEMAAARASVESQGIEFIIYSLMSWLRKWESQATAKLLTKAQRKAGYFVEYLLAGLVRGDLKSRYDAYRIALGGGATPGFITTNEIRRLENLPAVGPEGDDLYVPTNITTAKAMHESPPRPGDKTPKQPPPPKGGNLPEMKGNTEGAMEAWTRETAIAMANGNGRHKPRSAVIHSPQPDALRAAARGVLADVLGRFAAKEARAAERAAKGDWDQWCETFYPDHAAKLAAALKPAGALLATIGVTFDAVAAAGRLCDAGRAQLQLAYNTATPAQFAEKLGRWPGAMAESGAAEILGVTV